MEMKNDVIAVTPDGVEMRKGHVYVTTFSHDDWCELLNNDGDCNCDPGVSTKEIA